jgi:hypothetical protein
VRARSIHENFLAAYLLSVLTKNSSSLKSTHTS